MSHHSEGQSRSNRDLEVATIADKHNIPVHLPKRPSEIIDDLRNYQADAAILVSYGRIIPQSVIDIFPKGIINIHPSLLPLYRGPTPIESVITNGDVTTGVSVMQLTAGMDEGPVFIQQEIELDGTETKFELYERLSDLSTKLLFQHLPAILDRSLQPTAQHDSEATYCKLLEKADAWLNPRDYTAQIAERRVRAHLGFPKTKITIFGHDIIITKSHVEDNKKTPLDILCQDGAYLSIDELIAPSGRAMNAEAFLNGYAGD